jgi:hypothetical protein
MLKCHLKYNLELTSRCKVRLLKISLCKLNNNLNNNRLLLINPSWIKIQKIVLSHQKIIPRKKESKMLRVKLNLEQLKSLLRRLIIKSA